MTSHLPKGISDQMLHRIFSEYLEMPGLRLTRPQAQRLWGLDEETCARSLECLVDAGFLVRTNVGTYARLTDGATTFPRLPMAKGQLDRVKHRGSRAAAS